MLKKCVCESELITKQLRAFCENIVKNTSTRACRGIFYRPLILEVLFFNENVILFYNSRCSVFRSGQHSESFYGIVFAKVNYNLVGIRTVIYGLPESAFL